MQAFNGEEMINQFSVGKYRIDLYFPRYKLVIACVIETLTIVIETLNMK